MSSVSGNTRSNRDYALLLRAVGIAVPAHEALHIAANHLAAGRRSNSDKRVNATVCSMVAQMLGYPDAGPDMVERVLRNLPSPERGPRR